MDAQSIETQLGQWGKQAEAWGGQHGIDSTSLEQAGEGILAQQVIAFGEKQGGLIGGVSTVAKWGLVGERGYKDFKKGEFTAGAEGMAGAYLADSDSFIGKAAAVALTFDSERRMHAHENEKRGSVGASANVNKQPAPAGKEEGLMDTIKSLTSRVQ